MRSDTLQATPFGKLRILDVSLLRETPVQSRPREQLVARGAQALPDEQLAALLLGSGVRGHDVLATARDLIRLIDAQGTQLTVERLTRIRGIGRAKASLILAALEFSRRRFRPHGIRVRAASDAFSLVRHYADRPQEYFLTISLNGAHEVIATRVVTIGLVNATQVHPREVFSDPIVDRACAIIVAHNHPSGVLTPSQEDRVVTRTLVSAGALLGIKLLDHLVFSKDGFFSFAERGELQSA